MGLYHKLLRRLGYDTEVRIHAEYPRYEYKVTHTNGEISEDDGNQHRWEGAALLIEEADKLTWNKLTFSMPHHDLSPSKPMWSNEGFDLVRELESVKEVERERIGTDVIELVIDRADRELVDVTRMFTNGTTEVTLDS